ncbi:MAG: CNP1-like family protein [Ottowia sp.]|uniref:CNP1-like family protein n=1 Tax=unclassified Ottowia TaxID=2645081 RepID=UPI003C3028F2
MKKLFIPSRFLQVAAVAALVGLGLPAAAQEEPDMKPMTRYAGDDAPEWKEDTPPPPPAYGVKNLIDIEMPAASTVRMGVDPDTISLNKETGIVRYIVVARGPSAVNAMYEGIRCATGEYRVYARQTPGNDWSFSPEGEWKSMRGQVNYRHPYRLARDGVCIGTIPNGSVQEMVRALKSPKGTLYDD